MRETDLMLGRQTLLPAISITNPDLRAMIAQNIKRDLFGPSRRDFMQDRPVRDKTPLPVGDAVDARCRFIGGDDLRFAQSGIDHLTRLFQWIGLTLESIADRALGDRQPEHLAHQTAQPLEAHMMTVMQIKQIVTAHLVGTLPGDAARGKNPDR